LNIGLGIRNVGFIVKDDEGALGAALGESEEIDRIKFRTYNLGIPVGFKIGKLHQEKPFFLFAGYEVESPFHFKQKDFDGSDKENKRTDWFSDRTNNFQQAVWGGIQFPNGTALKVKYYLTDFFNDDFSETREIGGTNVVVRPYENWSAQVFYFSLEFYPFQDSKYYTKKL
jgi:hypothetical protein